MHRYNKLKLRVLSLFASGDEAWLGPCEAAERLNFLPPALGMVILQKVVEIRIAGEAFLGQRNIGIQDQRARRGTASVVTFAAQLKGGISGRRHLSAYQELEMDGTASQVVIFWRRKILG
jgi:hypothetical protein